MAVFSGLYENPGPPPLGDVRGIVPPHRDDHQNGHQSGYIIYACFVCPWTCCIVRCRMYRVNASTWSSKWPATEVHLFIAAAFFAWHNHS
jgi:hypothetical protein